MYKKYFDVVNVIEKNTEQAHELVDAFEKRILEFVKEQGLRGWISGSASAGELFLNISSAAGTDVFALYTTGWGYLSSTPYHLKHPFFLQKLKAFEATLEAKE